MNKFYGWLGNQALGDAFLLYLVFRIGKFAVRYTTVPHTGFGMAIRNRGIPHIHVQLGKLSVYFRWETYR